MNDDLILRARLHQQGWSDDQIEKYIGQGLVQGAKNLAGKYNQSRAAGHQGASLAQRFMFGGKQRYMDASGKTQAEYGQEMDDQAAAKQQEARNLQAARMQGKGVVPSTGAEAPLMQQTVQDPATGQDTTRTDLAAATVGDGSQNGNPNVPDEVRNTTTTQTMSDGSQNVSNVQDITMNANAQQQPAQQQPAAPQQPATGIDPSARAAAQQAMVQQDAATIQQGAGEEKKTWLKDRSLGGKLLDVVSGGLTTGFGETGIFGRNKANRASAKQNQQYQAALQRQNRMAKSMELYRDVISHRRAIQERNTTHNLRR